MVSAGFSNYSKSVFQLSYFNEIISSSNSLIRASIDLIFFELAYISLNIGLLSEDDDEEDFITITSW